MKGNKHWFILTVVFLAACGANEGILKSGKENSPQTNAAPSRSSFDEDLAAMRTANYHWIYVVSRKDGGLIDAEDRSVLRANTADADRRVSTDNDRAFIIGTNNPILAKNLAAIYARFAVEDLSPPPSANTNK